VLSRGKIDAGAIRAGVWFPLLAREGLCGHQSVVINVKIL
jgi:hypothetical protein